MSEIKMNNIPSMSVDKIVDYLSAAYTALILSGIPVKTFPAVMLWGAPGVGKSQAMRQVALEIERKTGKMVDIIDVRLILFNPVDLRGIPVANEERTLAVWLKPKIFQMDEGEDVINILFMDELSAASPSVQAAAYQIALDRMIGEHKLPDNCIVVAAGNRTTDKSVAYKMPKALANRLLHFEVDASFESWKKWAIEQGINEKVIGFLSFRQDYLFGFDSGNDDLAFATPRAWEMVSNVLNNICPDIQSAYPFIAGIIGTGMASEFQSWEKVWGDLPSVEEIFEGRFYPIPKNTDALYALISSMVSYAREHRDDERKIANSIKYANELPADFSAVLLKDYMYLDKDYKSKLMKMPDFLKWLQDKGKYLNGNL